VPRATISKRRRKETVSVAGDAGQKRNYELVMVLNTGSVEDKIETKVDALNQNIVDFGGEISGVEQWGRRKLAYPIKNLTEGYYVLTRCTMSPSQTGGLEAKLRISEDVLRHMLIKLDD
jgi:small subunit ribosomal protein S6